VGEGGRRDGVGHRAQDLRWESEAGAIQGDNIFIERAPNLEILLELPSIYIYRTTRLQVQRVSLLTVSVPEPSGFVVSKVMVKFWCRSCEVELGL
jgi:hypothetical protein